MEKEYTNVPLNEQEKGLHSSVSPNGTTSPERAMTRGQKIKRHFKRFWWIYLIALLLALLIIILCIIYVAMPHRAQSDVNRTRLDITEMQYLDPTGNSIVLTQRATLHNPSKFTPTLDPFGAAYYLVTNGTDGAEPILMIPIPEVHATKPTKEVVVENTNITFTSLEQATRYTMAVLGSENVTTALRGRTTLHLGSLPDTDVDYDEVVTFKGLNGLRGFNVTNLLLNPLATSGPNMRGFAYIPNPSVLTLALGNVSLSLDSNSLAVGNATIPNLTLRPGNNTFPMFGTLNTTLIRSNLQEGLINVNITGQSAIYNGQHLTYYEKALALAHLPLTINVTQVLIDSAAAAQASNAAAS